MEQSLRKYLTLAATGGLFYEVIELIWRGRSHWTMFLLGGLCFVALGLINERMPWDMPLWQQVLIGVGIVTTLEFVTGSIVNMWLGWSVWDYSGLWGNILGQICPQYCLLWVPISLAGIILDDWLRYQWWKEDQPRYNVGFTRSNPKILWLPTIV